MSRIRQTMVDEPLIPFALIGGVLFAVYGFRKPENNVESIEIRPATIRALETTQSELAGRPLTDEERQEIVEGLIEDEVLLREAFRMELEKKDSRVRKRLLNVMRSTLDQPVAPPTRSELEAYFRENQAQFQSGEIITFDHVFFAYGSENEPTDADELLESLRAGADHSQIGDDQYLGNVMRRLSKRQLRQMLGTDFADQAFSFPLDEWRGPIESRQGIHYLRVTEKGEPPPPSFEQMEEYLRQDWIFRKRRGIQSEKIAEIRERYVVRMKDEG